MLVAEDYSDAQIRECVERAVLDAGGAVTQVIGKTMYTVMTWDQAQQVAKNKGVASVIYSPNTSEVPPRL